MHIEAMDWDTGETVAWTRADVKDAHALGDVYKRQPFSHALKGASMTAPAQLADLAINQPDVALIFEGGGMRNSYTAPMVVELLARNLNFGCVYGISAGSSHTVNYLVRDATRARASFVELVKYPRFGGWGSFLRGTGYFNSPYLYEELIENAPAGDPMAFDLSLIHICTPSCFPKTRWPRWRRFSPKPSATPMARASSPSWAMASRCV